MKNELAFGVLIAAALMPALLFCIATAFAARSK